MEERERKIKKHRPQAANIHFTLLSCRCTTMRVATCKLPLLTDQVKSISHLTFLKDAISNRHFPKPSLPPFFLFYSFILILSQPARSLSAIRPCPCVGLDAVDNTRAPRARTNRAADARKAAIAKYKSQRNKDSDEDEDEEEQEDVSDRRSLSLVGSRPWRCSPMLCCARCAAAACLLCAYLHM